MKYNIQRDREREIKEKTISLLLYADDSCILYQNSEVYEIEKQLKKALEISVTCG